ncbi:FMRFamide receptor-like [Lingula anatina]|uniref:FMRFamide receptor-like n=1 Tax=Lingula anatina TaxID=7574 RepID=A0A2R2MT10_LINAN|nr:FMRFamide receptor-like [Lingula anatina]|eukprot:XP_023933157.1 FMRFamide receptor-like [Lingula anatina]
MICENNPDLVFFKETEQTLFSYIFSFYCIGTVAVAGIIGNILSIVVLSRDKSEAHLKHLLRGLALVDCVFLIFVLPTSVLPNGYPHIRGLEEYYFFVYPFLLIWLLPLMYAGQTASVWMVVMVTVDRYFAVCRPFSKFRFSAKRAAHVPWVVFLAAVIYNIPRFFERTFDYVNSAQHTFSASCQEE